MRLRTVLPPRRAALAVALVVLAAPFAARPARAQGAAPWQQRVAYEMDVTMDAPAHRMAGRQRLTLQNNSPDTLRQVFYHLYFNAFQKTSLMATRNRHLPDPDARVVPRIFEYTPDEEGWHRIGSLTQDGQPVPFRVDDTVLRADLATPIPPGGRAVFDLAFTSQVPLQTRRSGWKSREGIDFSMSQWYPKLAHYDARGWHADPYIGREFYGEFGTWDVRITLPSEYMVGGTGVVVNAEEVGKGYQRDTSRVVTHAPGSNLTWHFRAENVHDFAWVADRDYVHDRIDGPNGRQYHLLYQPAYADGWRFLRTFVPALFRFYEQRFGPYVWPQFTVAQAGDGGMEYPMINFITGGRTPNSLIGVTAHEAAHEWFYGMLGSNESDYAWMDEGFTEFATTEALTALFRGNAPAARADHRSATRGIVALQESGLFEPVSSPSDHYATNRAYSTASYGGGQMILDLLGYVLGDSVRDAGLRRYVQQYTLRHPQPADVERVMEAASGVQLDWFFQQVANSTRRLDLAVEGVRRRGDSTHVTLERKDAMFFPVDVRLTMADGTTRYVHVPTSEMVGAKAVPAGWTVARPWGWTHERYTFAVPGRVRAVLLDPDRRSPDYNRLNDADRFPIQRRFLRAPVANDTSYSVGWRPLATYAVDYGGGVGVRAAGTAWTNRHEFAGALKLWPQVIASNGDHPAYRPLRSFNPEGEDDDEFRRVRGTYRSWFEGVDYALRYATSPRVPGTRLRGGVSFEKAMGFYENRATLARRFGRWAPLGRDRGTLTAEVGHFRAPYARAFDLFDVRYAGYGAHRVWAGLRYAAGRGENRVELGGQAGSSVRALTGAGSNGPFPSNFLSDPTKVWVKAQRAWAFGPLTARARMMGLLGTQNLAFDERFVLGHGTPRDLWLNPATRAVLAAAGERYGTRVEESGGVPRYERTKPLLYPVSPYGPTGYALEREAPLSPVPARSTVTGNLELETRPVDPALPLRAFAFSGLAVLGDPDAESDGLSTLLTTPDFTNTDAYYVDAGLGLRLAVADVPLLRRWTAQSDALGALRLTARFPLWLFNPTATTDYVNDRTTRSSEDAFKFRYLLGVELGF